MKLLQPRHTFLWVFGIFGLTIWCVHCGARSIDVIAPYVVREMDYASLASISSVIMTMYTASRLFGPQVGRYAAVVLASMLYWTVGAHAGASGLDFCATLPITACGLLVAQCDDTGARERSLWMGVCWAGMALAVATRGVIGIALPAVVVICYFSVLRDRTLWHRLHIAMGVTVFLVLLVAWGWGIGVDTAIARQVSFFHQILQQAALAPYPFVWTWAGLLGLAPWVGALPQALVSALRPDGGRFQPRLMLLIWTVIGLLAVPLSYRGVLPDTLAMFPILALLVAYEFAKGRRRSRSLCAWALACVGLVLMAVPPILVLAVRRPDGMGGIEKLALWMLGAGFIAFVGAAFARFFVCQLKRELAIATLAVTGFVTAGIISIGSSVCGAGCATTALLAAIGGR